MAVVVPHVGTWIEMHWKWIECGIPSVVPHVGTWIEIPIGRMIARGSASCLT